MEEIFNPWTKTSESRANQEQKGVDKYILKKTEKI